MARPWSGCWLGLGLLAGPLLAPGKSAGPEVVDQGDEPLQLGSTHRGPVLVLDEEEPRDGQARQTLLQLLEVGAP
jgi:hypothetical protein